jgi:poly-gamma-glutamate capsule biosynthesis protein CapA/YwtB (metallophosphatase superfamily)
MLGRGVAARLESPSRGSLFAPEVVAAVGEADLCLLNLECCISDRGSPIPGGRFHFRAPRGAAEELARLGVDCVALANNHALDFGAEALLDTLADLSSAGIRWVGAGPDVDAARAPVVLEHGGFRLAVLAFADHPPGLAAAVAKAGVAFVAPGESRLPEWLTDTIRGLDVDVIVVSPHWGPNMVSEPVDHVRTTANLLLEAGVTLLAGHSAHVFHGIGPQALYDLGDFLDDYAIDRELRNDLGLLFLVDLAGSRVEAIPLKLEYAHTRFADGEDVAWIRRRLIEASAAFGTEVIAENGRLVAMWR